MIKFELIKKIFINAVILLVIICSGMYKVSAIAGEGCSEGQVVDYLAELTNLGVLADNSFEGKKGGLNRFGIKELEYLTSENESVTVEKLASICVDIMNYLGENKGIKSKKDYSDFQFIMDTGEILYTDGKWKPTYHRVVDEPLKDELDGRVIVKKLGRINDLSKAEKRHRLDLVTVLKKGIIIGKSLGKYSQKRNLEPKRKVGLSEVKKVIDRAYDRDKRYPMSPDGQLIRKTKLPVNASEYKYILAAFPNSFYETWFSYETSPATYQTLHTDYDPPKFAYNKYKEGYLTYNNIYEEADKIRRFQDHRFNVDYRTIDKKWGDKLVSFYKEPGDTNEDLKGIRNDIRKYIKFVKNHKLILEAKPSASDASFMYYDGFKPISHEHVKFRILSCENLDKNFDKIIYGVWLINTPYGISKHYKEKVELGKWIEGVYGIGYPEKTLSPLDDDSYTWKWTGLEVIDNTKRNIRKKKILKQFKITPKDELWYNPEAQYPFYGWK